MDETIRALLEAVKVGAKQSHHNMTLYCLLAANEAPVDFVTLDEALQKDFVRISEVSEGGSVPELKVANTSDRKVLLLDGEELVGAKQNRVLNVTILIAPSSETMIPVSCVEQGRWSYRSREFGSGSRAMSADLRKKKATTVHTSLRTTASFRSDQGTVWREIDEKYARMGTQASPTMAMADLYETHKSRTNEYLDAFRPVDHQIGMLVFIDGRFAGLELLWKFQEFRKVHAKLIGSYVMDALETAGAGGKVPTSSLRTKAARFLDSVRQASVERRKSVALGTDVRLESSDVIGSGLGFEGRLLHMSIFANDVNGAQNARKSGLERTSRRKRSFRFS